MVQIPAACRSFFNFIATWHRLYGNARILSAVPRSGHLIHFLCVSKTKCGLNFTFVCLLNAVNSLSSPGIALSFFPGICLTLNYTPNLERTYNQMTSSLFPGFLCSFLTLQRNKGRTSFVEYIFTETSKALMIFSSS